MEVNKFSNTRGKNREIIYYSCFIWHVHLGNENRFKIAYFTGYFLVSFVKTEIKQVTSFKVPMKLNSKELSK